MDDAMPSDGGRATAGLSDAERRELKEGLIAAVVGVGVDDAASSLLIQQLSTNPDALEPLVQHSLNEPARLAALRRTGMLDRPEDGKLDGVALLTAEALATPFAAVSLLDESREFLVGSNVAVSDSERVRPAGLSIGKFTVISGIPFIVDDATVHPLLANLPPVLNGEIGSYAGVPIFSDDDDAVGSLFSWTTRPHNWSGGQILVLQDMADLASAKIFRRPI
ncbi:GAF domain-containing protein [Mycobacterium sp. NPDC051804]|uniref:GAF domain-containing protein n=1 Tax=Mycobacterium sp. NPDC051804 TaxID=3364295 RepID=UPI00379ECB6B